LQDHSNFQNHENLFVTTISWIIRHKLQNFKREQSVHYGHEDKNLPIEFWRDLNVNGWMLNSSFRE
jgi:hypothetical protein